jgi:glycosyltransferase involved in cell wall biosynthesis
MGGAETNVVKITRELVERGYEVHLATLEDNGPLIEEFGYLFASKTVVGLFYKTPLKSILAYVNLLRKHSFQAVLNFGIRVEFFSRILTKSFSAQTKVIANIRSTDHWRKWYHSLLDQSTFGLVDVWVSNSEAGKQSSVNREGISPERIHVIYNFVESIPDVYNQLIPQSNPREIRLGLLANITRNKGYYDLLDIVDQLIKKGYSPKVYCGGVDRTGGDFEKELKSRKLESYFHLLGYISDKANFFEQIEIFVLPSYLEGMPTVVLEAMQFGKPIVTTGIDGMLEQIKHLHNGWLSAPGDIDSFVEGILELHNNEAIRKRFIENSTLVLKGKFDKIICIKQWIGIIESKS